MPRLLVLRSVYLICLGLAPAIACARTSTVDSRPASPAPEVPLTLLRPVSLYDIRAEVMPLNEYQDLPDALELPILGETAPGPGAREIRIYTGIVIGYPHSGLILREEAGRVSGRLVRYWPVNDTMIYREHDLETRYAAHEAGRCEPPRRGARAVVCTVRFVREPDWRTVLANVDSVNGWSLPDEREVPRRGWIVDGWRMRVEARNDTSYNAYGYHNPQIYRPPEGPAALRLMWLVDSLFGFTVPPGNLRHERGLYLYGPDTSDFLPCGDRGAPGYSSGRLGPIVALVGDSAWKARTGPTRAFEVEAWVRERTGANQREGKRTYDRTWSVDSVTAVRPAPDRRCGSGPG